MLELSYLKEQGFKITQEEAHEFLSEVNAVKNGLNETGIIFPDNNEDSDIEVNASKGAKRGPKGKGDKAKDTEPSTINRAITQEDLDADPTLAGNGLKVGDLFDFPIVTA